MRTAGEKSRVMWERILTELIGADGTLSTTQLQDRLHLSTQEIYPRLAQLEAQGIIVGQREPSLRNVYWLYIGQDIARGGVKDLDTPVSDG